MNGFLSIDLAAACTMANRKHVWADPDEAGRCACVVCGEPLTAANADQGVPRAVLLDEMTRGPLERGITG